MKSKKGLLTKSTEWLGALVGGAAIAWPTTDDDDDDERWQRRIGRAIEPTRCAGSAVARVDAALRVARAPIAEGARTAKAIGVGLERGGGEVQGGGTS